MISIKLLIEKDTTNEAILLRAGIALLCAHFEGFLKYASNRYVHFVAEKNITTKALKNNFAAFKIQNEITDSEKTEKNSVHQKLVSKFIEIYEQPFKIYTDVISTNSNPSSSTIKEIVTSLGLTTDIFNTKNNYIDRDLLGNRNKVVHGERYPIHRNDFNETYNIIMDLLDKYYEFIIDAADQKQYLKEGH